VRKSRLEFSWRLLPYAGLKVRSLNRPCGLRFQEHPILSRVESLPVVQNPTLESSVSALVAEEKPGYVHPRLRFFVFLRSSSSHRSHKAK
jgi:hypothetical protein